MAPMRELDYDVVIIGSGAAGGTVAQALGPLVDDGRRVAVLEWGPKLKEEEYTGRELDMTSRLYFDGGGTFTKDRAMTLAYGRAYGGSTVVYTGTSLTMPEEVVDRWNVPGLEFADLDRRARKYLEENNVHLLPEEDHNDNNRLFGFVQPRLPEPGETGHPPGPATGRRGRRCGGDHQLPGHAAR
jgi:choline dehydrogenase-like flavoprotein